MGLNYWEFIGQFNEGHNFSTRDPPIYYRTLYELYKASRGNMVLANVFYAEARLTLSRDFGIESPPQLIVQTALASRVTKAESYKRN